MEDMLGEQWLSETVDLLVRVVEAAGALVIFVGAMVALVRFVVVGLRDRRSRAFVPVRLALGRFLVLGLEFQLASDILRTAIAPTLLEIAELAAVATIRTGLNFFLAREIKQERRELEEAGHPPDVDPARAPGGHLT
ncbi:DUF1622 domain-containing protein [Micromonospora sp. NPDC126480]|uniref:DUF1622 domain-containing protein n=1 Tax=Micromonospora sp. NPDC126480 TaxID=3155312 RepID=UPI003318ABA4